MLLPHDRPVADLALTEPIEEHPRAGSHLHPRRGRADAMVDPVVEREGPEVVAIQPELIAWVVAPRISVRHGEEDREASDSMVRPPISTSAFAALGSTWRGGS